MNLATFPTSNGGDKTVLAKIPIVSIAICFRLKLHYGNVGVFRTVF